MLATRRESALPQSENVPIVQLACNHISKLLEPNFFAMKVSKASAGRCALAKQMLYRKRKAREIQFEVERLAGYLPKKSRRSTPR